MVNGQVRDSSPDKPAPVLNCARLLQYAVLDGAISYCGHSALFVGGKEVGPVPCLAITRNLQDGEVFLMHCARDWTVLGVAVYESVAVAKERAEGIYQGVSARWVEAQVTDQEVSDYLDEIWGDDQCSFCGKRPYEVDQIISSGQARICDLCIEELHKELHESSDAKQ